MSWGCCRCSNSVQAKYSQASFTHTAHPALQSFGLDCGHWAFGERAMDSYRDLHPRVLWLLAGVLALATPAGAQAPPPQRPEPIPPITDADVQREQDKAAAIVDSVIPDVHGPVLTLKEDPPLKPGPALSASRLTEQVHSLARALRRYADTEPDRVQRVLGIALPYDAEGRHRGTAGKFDTGTYAWTVSRSTTVPVANSVRLSLNPPTLCLSIDELKAPLLADRFKMYVPTFGDDDRILFYKPVESQLTLYVHIAVDRLDKPTCGRTVTFDIAPSDD